MADFLLPEDLTDEIFNYFSGSFTNEPCGAILTTKNGLIFKPLINLSPVEDTFSIDPIQWAKYNRYIWVLVHGHSDNCTPSEHDIIQCDLHNKPYVIINQQTKEYFKLNPKNYTNLMGKEYRFGVHDCFESLHRWFLVHNIPLPLREAHWKDDWWDLGEDYIGNELANWSFVPTQVLEYGNLLTFSMGSKNGIPNHLGVYTGEDQFFHHAVNRLSVEENLYPLWGKYITGIYKYEKSTIRRLPRGEIW